MWKTQDVEDFQCETSLPKEKEEKLLQSFRQCFTSIASEQSINSHGVSEGLMKRPDFGSFDRTSVRLTTLKEMLILAENHLNKFPLQRNITEKQFR